MNYILTCSRSGSTILGHSLNYACGNNLDVDITKPEVDFVIGEHAHEDTPWTVDQILNFPPLATKIKPEITKDKYNCKFLELSNQIKDEDKIIWYKRNNKDILKSYIVWYYTKMFHITDDEQEAKYLEKLKNLKFSDKDLNDAITYLKEIHHYHTERQEKILQSTNAQTMVIWHENFMRNPTQILLRIRDFFDLPFITETPDIYTTCRKLPKHEELNKAIDEKLSKIKY
jgi:hypothetical protein